MNDIFRYMSRHNLKDLQITFPQRHGDLFHIRSSFWTGNDWMGVSAYGVDVEEVVGKFEARVRGTPNKKRAGSQPSAYQILEGVGE